MAILPVLILADGTKSMNRKFRKVRKIDELNNQLQVFLQTLYQDENTSEVTHIAVYKFAQTIQPVQGEFTDLKQLVDNPPIIEIMDGVTCLATAIDQGIDVLLEYVDKIAKTENIHTPMLVVLTDGLTMEYEDEVLREKVRERTKALARSEDKRNKLTLVMIAISNEMLDVQNSKDENSELVQIRNMLLDYTTSLHGFFNICLSSDENEESEDTGESPFKSIFQLLTTSTVMTAGGNTNEDIADEIQRKLHSQPHPGTYFITGPV